MSKQNLIAKVTQAFQDRFEGKPLVVYSPGRINLIGEHTDYNDGFVFPAAIDKGIVAAFQKSDTQKTTLHALDKNDSFEFDVNHLEPVENNDWRNYILGVVSELHKMRKMIEPFHMVFSGNIPGGAGMSSSAALENSVVVGLNALFNLGLRQEEMIFISQKAEHHFVGVQCGIMDQYASMFGKENSALLLDCRSLQAETFKIDFKEYGLLLINTNVKHTLSDSAYNDRRAVCEKASELLNIKALRDANCEDLDKIKSQLSEDDLNKVKFVINENSRAQKAGEAIKQHDLETLGALIYQSHLGLSKNYKVSCKELDFLVDETLEIPEILGARMMGGGFGGCTINLIRKDYIPTFSKNVAQKYLNKFNKACSIYEVALCNGTEIISA